MKFSSKERSSVLAMFLLLPNCQEKEDLLGWPTPPAPTDSDRRKDLSSHLSLPLRSLEVIFRILFTTKQNWILFIRSTKVISLSFFSMFLLKKKSLPGQHISWLLPFFLAVTWAAACPCKCPLGQWLSWVTISGQSWEPGSAETASHLVYLHLRKLGWFWSL